MAIGTGTAILGSALIGGGLGLFGSQSAAKTQANASLQGALLQSQAADRAMAAQRDASDRALPLISGGFGDARNILSQYLGLARDASMGGTRNAVDASGDWISRAIAEARSYGNQALDAQRSGLRGAENYLSPYVATGQNALTSLNDLYGPNGPSQNALAAFRASPDYDFALKGGIEALENSNAARGLLRSGSHLRGITSFGQGLASQQYGNYVNRLQGLAGLGATAAGAGANASLMSGNNQAGILTGIGGQVSGTQTGFGNLLANLYNGSGGSLAGLFSGQGNQLSNLFSGEGTTLGNAVLGQGTQIGNLLMNQGNAQAGGITGAGQANAAGIVGGTNAVTGSLNSGMSNYLLWNALNRGGNTGTIGGTGGLFGGLS